MIRHNRYRWLSFILAVLLIVSSNASVAFAIEGTGSDTGNAAGEVSEQIVNPEETPAAEGLDPAAGDESPEGQSEDANIEDQGTAEEEQTEDDQTEEESAEPIEYEGISDYQSFIEALTVLEGYAEEYAGEHAGEDAAALVINYIRTGVEKYTSSSWTTFCGEEKKAFTNYVAEQDAANNTRAGDLKKLGEFTLPNGDEVEFAHMFGCMDMAYHTGNQNTADLGSWAGDLCDLVQLSQNGGVSGTVEEMAEEIRTNNSKYFLYDDPNAHSFGQKDLYGDMDSYYILRELNGRNSISSIMKSYYTKTLNDKVRAAYFLKHRLGGVSSRNDIRNKVFDIYTANEGIKTLEGTYLPDGVNADIRKACCYAFADYLYETAIDTLENTYYKVFSTSSSVLAPGVVREDKLAITADDKQIAYYVATVDINRKDVSVHANYNNNDGSKWQMARVTDQMAAAQKKHSDPDSENYVQNYNAVLGTNGDFYNMSTGAPSGALVMEGKEYHGVGNENFFAILKNGKAIIGGKSDYAAYKNDIQEAVGGGAYLVRNGEISVSSSSNYYLDRASRTCVGITYDGKVVMMVLDGRQEPYSAGGSAVEIAQIMLDAGCETAINLDGGGSTTFAGKAEGSEEIAVLNRPSDGYERSVSSSLLVVSTAKPSNVFDHASVTADYDYVTVGTELQIDAAGVTATGGAIDLPEGSTFTVADSSIGTISDDGVFKAAAVGDTQVRLLSAEGDVLGSKTIHVVQPTDIRFTKNSINAVYGKAEDLPLEATYNGNLVKINNGDVTFGFVKISLQSIGSVEGGSVNTTKTELVFEYPEAGTINDFKFTGNEDGGLRVITVGAVLTNKLDEFQAIIGEEYQRVYAEALSNGFSKQEAALQAQEAGVNKALASAAKLDIYLYNADEATFDFGDASGGNDLLAWDREVSNSNYKQEIETYYCLDPEKDMETSYTFAVDMSKVPIPKKLTGLLYMLPGGDQEGRTAWDFLLQLAERISPLTTVTVTINIPDGFDADIKDLKIVNEYFNLTSAEVKDGKIVVVCNFKEQGEPINPATANPLCVLSGIKLTPNENAAWNDADELKVSVSGGLGYDIYAHFHILKSLAQQEEYQVNYGLYPYDNSKNINGDYGAHFFSSDDPEFSFTDEYTLCNISKNGWERNGDNWSYYENGVALTGPQKLPSNVDGEDGEFWYDFGTEGSCKDKLTGIFEKDGDHFYARMGVLIKGWQSIVAEDGKSYFYYFDKNDYKMHTGVSTVDGLTYTFNDEGQLIRGAFRTNSKGTKYFWAGESLFRRFIELEEGTYWLDTDGYVAYGNAFTVTTNVKDITWYHFNEETGLLEGTCSGFFDYKGELYYCDENGKVFYGAIGVDDGVIFTATRGKVYVNQSCYIDSTTAQRNCSLENGKYWCGEDGFIVGNGFVDIDGSTYYFKDYKRAKGLTKIGDDYYLFNAGNGKMYKDATMWVGANDYGIESGMHYFDKDGKMFIPAPESGTEIVEEDGKLYLKVDGVIMKDGLHEVDGEYYYAQKDGTLAVDKTIWVDQRNGLIPEKGDWHYFDAEGKLQQTGFVDGGDGYTYYYDKNVLALGFTKIGDDYYLFNAGSGKMYKDADMWVKANDYGVETGMHYFGKDGKMFIPAPESGTEIVEQDGKLYLKVDGVIMKDGLHEVDGEYYYAQKDGTLAVDKTIWVDQRNGLIPEKGDWHYFDAEGKLQQTGFVDGGDGYTYYYDKNVLALGFTKIGDDYYLFNAGSGKMYKDADMWVKANDYGVETGMHYFDADGKMTE